MVRMALFALLGYLSGSVLYANLALALFGKQGALEKSCDRNPGTANAFQYGGFTCGVLTLAGDLFKGYLPVHLYLSGALANTAAGQGAPSWALALILAAPVLGHVFSCLHHFHGGKGIAVTFGCLLGLAPDYLPLCVLAAVFIFFCTVIRISPDFYRTIAAYLATGIVLGLIHPVLSVRLGFYLITGTVCFRLYRSDEQREKMKVRILWKH